MKGEVEDFFRLNPEVLFLGAQEIAKQKKMVYCSRIVLSTECQTKPGCRHCKWGYAKNKSAELSKIKTLEEIKANALELKNSGIHRVLLTSGWLGYELPNHYYECVTQVKKYCDMDVYAEFGAINRQSLLKLKKAGLDGYLCSLESPNRNIYLSFRPGGDTMGDRIKTLRDAKELGLKIWSGFLVGMGEDDEDISQGLNILQLLHPDAIQIIPFRPFPCTKMSEQNSTNPYEWARILAVARVFLQEPDLFTEHATGLYHSYGVMAGGNGFYGLPKNTALINFTDFTHSGNIIASQSRYFATVRR